MGFRVRSERVNGEEVHSCFDEELDQFTGLELVDVTGKVPPTPFNDRFWALRYDGEFVYRRNGKLFTFDSVEEGILAVRHEYLLWQRKRQRR